MGYGPAERNGDDRASARATRAVGRRERLVDIDVHAVEAHFGGLDDAEDGVQVRTVAVHQTADAMDGRGNLAQLLLEKAQCVRIGEHQADHGVVQIGFQLRQVDIAARV